MLNPAVSSILESPSVVPSKVEASSTKEASLNVEYGNAIQENFGLKEAVYYKGIEIGRRMHRIAAGIWKKFLYDEGVTSEEEKVLYEEDPILLQLQQEEKFARIAEATHTV